MKGIVLLAVFGQILQCCCVTAIRTYCDTGNLSDVGK